MQGVRRRSNPGKIPEMPQMEPHRSEPTRVFILSDVRLCREALAQILEAHPVLALAGSRRPDAEALAAITRSRAQVVLVDWPTVRGTEIVPHLARLPAEVNVIAYGVLEDEDEVLACAAAGIAGYIPRQASPETLVRMVEAVVRGELLCSPRMAALIFRRVGTLEAGPRNGAAPALPPLSGHVLTPREQEVAALLEAGLSNKEIARSLGIRVPTVKNHVHSILERLQVRRRGEAAAVSRERHPHLSALPAGPNGAAEEPSSPRLFVSPPSRTRAG